MKLKAVTGIMLTLVVASIVMVSVGTASLVPVITQMDSTVTVYFDPPTINGTAIGEEFTVNITIRDAQNIIGWMAGLTFNATLLNCTGFFEGEFLSDVGPTYWIEGTINNTAGVIDPPYGCTFLGAYKASGDGRLAYATFKVKAPGVSDLHLIDVAVVDYYDPLKRIPTNIVDVFTVIVDNAPYTVVTVSNSTGRELSSGSGFYGHAFIPGYGISFNVEGPYWGFSNVTIPETLMSGAPNEWIVILDGTPLDIGDRTVTYNGTHYSVYFTYSNVTYTHAIQITSAYVLPEFPTTIILSLFMFFTLVAVALTKNHHKRNSKDYPNPA